MKILNWEHSYTVTLNDEVEVPDDFEVADHYAKWGTITLVGKDGTEIEFESSIDYELDCKRPAVSNVYNEKWEQIEGLEYE